MKSEKEIRERIDNIEKLIEECIDGRRCPSCRIDKIKLQALKWVLNEED